MDFFINKAREGPQQAAQGVYLSVAEQLSGKKQMFILDLGCGTGCELSSWGVNSSDRVIGIDIDYSRVMTARKRFPVRACAQAAGEWLPFKDQSFDWVISGVAIPYMNIPKVMAEVRRCLVPGGRFSATLHPPSFSWGELIHNALPKPIPTLFRLYVIANGVWFHVSGSNVGFLRGRTESFQTEHGMRRALTRAGFDNIAFCRAPGRFGETFTVQARHAQVGVAEDIP